MSGFHLVADLEANHSRFVERVRDHGDVRGIRNEQGILMYPSNHLEETWGYPFWSDHAYAKRHCVGNDRNPFSINFDSFIDVWLQGLHKDGHLVGTNWNADLAGLEIEPYELAIELWPETPDDV
jgi:hypothetical protein